MSFAVLQSPEEWRSHFGSARSVLGIGNFDGVHLGHQKILRRVVDQARRGKSLAAVITFWPHPLRLLRPESAPLLIETLAQRLARLEGAGLDAALVLHFDCAIASLSPEEFVRRIVVEHLRANAVLVGENFRFGNRQAGDVPMLNQLGHTLGFEVECIPPVVVRHRVVSSSSIRSHIAQGHTAQAARLLGRPFALAGEICRGAGTGHRTVFPTLNLSTEQELLPARGVYVTETVVEGQTYRSATNVGFRPTFNGTRLTVESHLFDFSRELNSGPLEIRFWRRLRDEQKFAGPEALRAQIQHDLIRARSFFTRLDAARRIARIT